MTVKQQAPPTLNISDGKFKILLLKRRDLPLKIASYVKNILQFKVCNTLKLYVKQGEASGIRPDEFNTVVSLL